MWLKWKIVVNIVMKLIYACMKNFLLGKDSIREKYEVIKEIDQNFLIKSKL